jgi:hypothetical protein
VFDVGGELPAESSGILCAQVDLVVGAADPEPHCFICRAALEIVFQEDGYLVAIVASMPVMGYLHGIDHLPLPRSTAAHRSPPGADSGEPNGEPTLADIRPHQATTSHGFGS